MIVLPWQICNCVSSLSLSRHNLLPFSYFLSFLTSLPLPPLFLSSTLSNLCVSSHLYSLYSLPLVPLLPLSTPSLFYRFFYKYILFKLESYLYIVRMVIIIINIYLIYFFTFNYTYIQYVYNLYIYI